MARMIGATRAAIIRALGGTPITSTSGLLSASNNLSDVASAATSRTNLGLATVASSASASDLSAGTLAAARGGAGTVNGIMKANGSGTVAAVTVGTGLSFDGTTLSSSAGASGLTLLATVTASSSAALDNTANITSTYDAYEIHLENIVPATNGDNIILRFSTDGGSTWLATSYLNTSSGGGTSGIFLNNATVTGNTVSGVGVDNTASKGFSGKVFVVNPNSSAYKMAVVNGVFISGGTARFALGAGLYNGATTAVNGFRIICPGGDISTGKARFYGVKTS